MTGSLNLDLTEIRKIALFRALYLGDLICATPALRALRSRFPSAEITLIALPWAETLAGRLPEIDRFEIFPGYPGLPEVPADPHKTEAFLDRMREEAFDLAIQLHGDGTASNGFVAALGARHSLGFATGPDPRLTVTLPWREAEHEVRRWLRLVAQAGAESDERVSFPITPADDRSAGALLDRFAGDGPRVGLHAGSKLPSRRWPAERFAALGNLLAEWFGAGLILTGGAQERPLTAAMQERLRTPALDLTGRTDLGTLAAVIARLDLLVTNDTGVSHLAAATGTRSVVLFGPSDPRRWAPLDRSRHTVIDPAAGALDRRTASVAMPVEQVAAACERALREAAFRPRLHTVSTETPPVVLSESV